MILVSSFIMARFDAKPIQSCEAYNNMKHTKNTHHVILDTSKKYTVLKHHKGQNLILVKGEQPSQRWVDDTCFSKKSQSADAISSKNEVINIEDELRSASVNMSDKSHNNLLALSWHNAFCETHRYKKECKRSMFSFARPNYRDKHFVLHGLWPQPKNRSYCNVSSVDVNFDKHKQWNRLPDLGLSDEVKQRLKKVMPGFASNLHKHEWIKHGTCYGTDANSYYDDATHFVQQVNDSKVGNFFRQNIGKRVTLQQVRAVFNINFGVGTGKRVELKCRKGLVSELWLHLGAGSKDLAVLLKQGRQTRSRCQGGFIDKAGFGR